MSQDAIETSKTCEMVWGESGKKPKVKEKTQDTHTMLKNMSSQIALSINHAPEIRLSLKRNQRKFASIILSKQVLPLFTWLQNQPCNGLDH
jgi:hypothetical protein